MQLVSCTHCRKTWEHVEMKRSELPKESRYISIRTTSELPCPHKCTVEDTNRFNKEWASVFTQIYHIPTLPDVMDIELVSLLFHSSLQERNAILEYYSAVIAHCSDVIEPHFTIDGESFYLDETIHYKGQEVQHLSYYEQEREMHVFAYDHLRVLAYLYQKYPVKVMEGIEAYRLAVAESLYARDENGEVLF